MQTTAPAGGGRTVRRFGRIGGARAAHPSGLPGSPTGGGLEERERKTIERRLRDAHLPRMKTLEEFDFRQSPKISPAEIRELASGYIERAEPILLIGDAVRGILTY